MHASDSRIRENVDLAFVRTVMKSKICFGMGIGNKHEKSQRYKFLC
jgi:hypothetical protein